MLWLLLVCLLGATAACICYAVRIANLPPHPYGSGILWLSDMNPVFSVLAVVGGFVSLVGALFVVASLLPRRSTT